MVRKKCILFTRLTLLYGYDEIWEFEKSKKQNDNDERACKLMRLFDFQNVYKNKKRAN